MPYRPKTVILHDGDTPRSGLYICAIIGRQGNWRYYDDSSVSNFDLDTLNKNGVLITDGPFDPSP